MREARKSQNPSGIASDTVDYYLLLTCFLHSVYLPGPAACRAALRPQASLISRSRSIRYSCEVIDVL